MRHSHSLGQGRGSGYRSDADTRARPRIVLIRKSKCTNVSNRMSATSLSFIFKTVFRRSQRPFWFFSVTRVANLALSNSFLLLVVAERNGARTTRLSLSAMLPECQQTLSKSPVRARRSRDHVNVRQSKLRLAPPLWFRAIKTIRNFS